MAPDESSVARSAQALGTYFMGDVSIAEALERVCEAAVAAIPVATRAGISMTVEARPGTYVSTHPAVQAIEQPQYDTGDGPCVDAFMTGHVTIVDDTLRAGPYAAFRKAASEHDLRSVMSIPLTAGAHVVGAINLYSPSPAAFDADAARQVEVFATHAAYLLLNHQAYWDARSLGENLREALASRAVIEQAKGVIMGTTGCSPDEAFDQLRRQSQHENVKVRDLAEQIVRSSSRRRQHRD